MFIPAYFYPGTLWTQAINAGSKVGVMVMNPFNGPGASQNSSYVTAVNQAKAAGIKVLGYVYTGYGTRGASIVKADIDTFYNWYNVDGIFFDEGANNATYLSYYQDLTNYVKAKGSNKMVILNPGVVPDEGYVKMADSVIVFENDYSQYANWNPPSWVNNYPADKFTHIMYNTPASALSQALTLAKQRRAGFVYMTDDVLTNPWDSLPSYWSNEISQLCSSPAVTPIPSPQPTPSLTPVLKTGDANGDNRVDGVDYVIWLNHYGSTTANKYLDGDYNGDSKVDGVDYVLWLNNYGR
jgi:hypothetical protein